MPPTRFACPECNSLLQDARGLAPESSVRCPRCGHVFKISDAVDPDAPASNPEDAPWKPNPNDPGEIANTQLPIPPSRSVREEDAPADHERGDAGSEWEDSYEDEPSRRRRRQRGLAGVDRDTALEMDQCFNLAGANYSDVMGAMIGYFFLAMLIGLPLGCIPYVGALLRFVFLDGVLQAGFVIVALKQLQGKRWEFGDFFKGFTFYVPILINQLVIGGIALVMAIPYIGILFTVIAAGPGGPGGPRGQQGIEIAMIVLVAVQLVFLLVGGYFLVRLSCFNLQFIVDRECSAGEAIQGSWMQTRKHFWGVLGFGLLCGLINLGGVLLLCVGILFTMPYVHLLWNACYLLLAGSQPPVDRKRRTERD